MTLILLLVSFGTLRVFKAKAGKRHHLNRAPTSLSGLHSAMALSNIAQAPKREDTPGINILRKETHKTMKNLKVFFDKFKGYILTAALAVLTVVEMCGGFINQLCGGVLVVHGIEVLPLVTLVCTAVVGVLSNGFTKEQAQQIKTIVKAPDKNATVKGVIKDTIKAKNEELTKLKKSLATMERELVSLEGVHVHLSDVLMAQREMSRMDPAVTTLDDVRKAETDAREALGQVEAKKAEIEKTKASIEVYQTKIAALKLQLQ